MTHRTIPIPKQTLIIEINNAIEVLSQCSIVINYWRSVRLRTNHSAMRLVMAEGSIRSRAGFSVNSRPDRFSEPRIITRLYSYYLGSRLAASETVCQHWLLSDVFRGIVQLVILHNYRYCLRLKEDIWPVRLEWRLCWDLIITFSELVAKNSLTDWWGEYFTFFLFMKM